MLEDNHKFKLCMTTFNIKQTSVQAVRFTDENKDRAFGEAREWQLNISHGWDDKKNPVINIPDLESHDVAYRVCQIGDWIVKHPSDNRLQVWSDEAFQKSFNLAN